MAGWPCASSWRGRAAPRAQRNRPVSGSLPAASLGRGAVFRNEIDMMVAEDGFGGAAQRSAAFALVSGNALSWASSSGRERLTSRGAAGSRHHVNYAAMYGLEAPVSSRMAMRFVTSSPGG